MKKQKDIKHFKPKMILFSKETNKSVTPAQYRRWHLGKKKKEE